MSNQDKVQDFIDNVMMDVSDSEFDYDLSEIELDSLTISHGRVDDFDLSGQPIVEEFDFVYCNVNTLESKLLEMLESVEPKNPEMSTVYDAVNAVLKDTIIVAQGGFKPYVVDVEQVTREIVLNIVGEE